MQYRNLGRLKQPASLDFRLNNCGYYLDVDRPLHTRRDAGSRTDHHIILVRRGEFQVLIQDQWLSAQEGSLVYIPPGAPQDYVYTAGPGTGYYWLHFDGPEADRMISRMGLTWSICQPGQFPELRRLLEQLLSFPAYHRESYYTGLNGYLQIFLSTLSRSLTFPGPADSTESRLMEIIHAMDSAPEDALSNAAYAAQCGISEYHFTRLFRQQTGLSPHRYRNRALMEKAQQLLTDTDMNVSEVARAVHIQDPLYFSRLFKQHFGCSPREYRTQK